VTARRLPLNLLCGVLLAVTVAQSADAKVVHRQRSLYSTILVDQRGSEICLQFSVRRDQRNQSCMDKRRPRDMVLAYTRMMMTGLLVQPTPQRVLMIGMGGGTIPTVLAELYPDAAIDVVEIDPAVVTVAEAYFDFVTTANMRIFKQDGRVFVKRAALNDVHYDLILLDAFNGDYIPEHLMTREFLQEVKSLLSPGAVAVANTFAISQLYHHESTTYHDVFGDFLNLKSNASANRVILAVNGPLPDNATMRATAEQLRPKVKAYGLDLRKHVRFMERKPDWDPTARPLTDQYAPANLLRDR
jgi:spermidine synthase